MSTPERRTPEELRTLYRIEPSVRDIVVEGRDDRRLVAWYLKERGVEKPRVYAVDDRVDPRSLSKVAPNPGKRDYVLALADEIGALDNDPSGITCVVDSDHDAFAGTAVDGPSHLLRTDFGSMDVYAFQERPLQQMLEVGLGRETSAALLISDLTPLLVDLAVARRALHEVGVPVVDRFTRLLKNRTAVTLFDVPALIQRSLNARGEVRYLRAVVERADYYRALVPPDPRTIIRGHDIAPLIAWHQRLTGDHAKPDNLESMMRTSLQATDLDEQPLFRTLIERVSA